MTEYTPEIAGRVVRLALLDCWRAQLAAGHLTRAGLMSVRWRLDPLSGEFEPGADLELVRLEVDEAVAALYGAPLEDMPGREIPPPSRW